MKSVRMSLRQVRRESQLWRMPRDNFDRGDWWMITDGHTVSIAEQKIYEQPTQNISIPKGIFDWFVDIYVRPVLVRSKPQSKRKGK